ncbi:MAG: hypothetical protein DYG98_27105 [Haliscomenobacteraceae bacterium CHB4]|nr:hypothetical protein [Haliscomenobacteraceae bacterium CHB4]
MGLVELAKIAGLAGLVIGTFLSIFRTLISKILFPNLTPEHSYNVIRLIILAVWTLAIIGISLWFYLEYLESKDRGMKTIVTTKQCADARKESEMMLKIVEDKHRSNTDKYDDIKFIYLETILKNNISLTTCDSLSVILENIQTAKNFLSNYEK